MSIEAYRFKANVLKALAHPTRLMVVDLLLKGPRCVCDLVAAVGCDQSTLSKHLAVMRAAGVVDDRKDGVRTIYRLTTPCVAQFFSCVDAVIKTRLERQRSLLRARR